jgi:hypothetical protein
MLPSGYPGVVRDGVAALNWAGAVMERALQRIPDWIAELDPANEKGLAEAKERARREGRALLWSIPDASSLTQAFTDNRAEVTELGTRLERRTAIEWQSGAATQYFTGVELRILESWADGAGEHLAAWLGETRQEIRRRQMEFGALGKWLRDYLDSNA